MYQKFWTISIGNFLFEKSAFHLSQVKLVHRPLSLTSQNLPQIFRMEANKANQMLCKMLEVSIEQSSLINSEDDAVDIFLVASMFMRQNLK